MPFTRLNPFTLPEPDTEISRFLFFSFAPEEIFLFRSKSQDPSKAVDSNTKFSASAFQTRVRPTPSEIKFSALVILA